MQLRSVQIRNIRGLRDLTIPLQDRGIVLLGPNGSGKSSVVDALDLLFTGGVRHLEGQGAGGLSLLGHGKHVDADAASAWVEGTFTVPQEGAQSKPITVRRSMRAPAVDASTLPPVVAQFLEHATTLGHHLLSRREILRFVLARPSERLDRIAPFLHLERVDEQRLELSSAAREATASAKLADGRIVSARAAFFATLSPAAKDMATALERVNEIRSTLNGEPLPDLETAPFTDGVAEPRDSEAPHPLRRAEPVLRRLLEADLAAFLTRLTAYVTDLGAALAKDAQLVASERDLVKLGSSLFDGAHCPLCKSPVDEERLRADWNARLLDVDALSVEIDRLRQERADLQALQDSVRRDLREAHQALSSLPQSDVAALDDKALRPVPQTADDLRSFDVQTLTATVDRVRAYSAAALETSARLPRPTGRARAWAELLAAGRSHAELTRATLEAPRLKAAAKFLSAAEKAFLTSRDDVLGSIYAEIGDRVEALYAKVHTSNQSRKTVIRSTKTGLELEVDFHGRGAYPPSALHSEGQQDTLGICLFLALAERASGGTPPILVLDDVLMSVDAEHRRSVAELLVKEFPSTQFIITTHDRVWANQLKSAGVVAKKIELQDWSIDGANTVATGDAFALMRAHLAAGLVPAAAHELRRTMEAQLPEVCEALGAQVRFSQSGKYELGDLYDPAVNRFAKLLGDGIKAAKAFKKDAQPLEARAQAFETAKKSVSAEGWSVNANVHFNEWAQMTPPEFAPVVDAYERLFQFFECESCKGLFKSERSGVRCKCGEGWVLKVE